MSDLVEFLTARLDEDKQTAFASERFIEAVDDEPSEKGKEWAPSDGAVITAERGEVVAEVTIWKPEPIAEHIARWDPAHVLSEVEAKRRILELAPSPDLWRDDGHGDEYCDENPAWELWMDTLKALASVYADHPDYRQEWKP